MAEVVVHPTARRRGIGADLIRAGLAAGWRRHPDLGARRPRGRAGDGRRAGPRRRARTAADAAVAGRPARGRRRPGGGAAHLRRPRRRRRAAARQQRRVRLAPGAGRLDRGRHRRAARRVLVRPRRAVPGVRRRLGCSCSVSTGRRCTANGLGEVYVVGVDPAAQGRGLGRTADAGRAALSARRGSAPTATVMLYVEADNTAAVKTYERARISTSSARTSRTPRVSPSAVKSLRLFTSRSPSIREPSITAAYVAGESEARQPKVGSVKLNRFGRGRRCSRGRLHDGGRRPDADRVRQRQQRRNVLLERRVGAARRRRPPTAAARTR